MRKLLDGPFHLEEVTTTRPVPVGDNYQWAIIDKDLYRLLSDALARNEEATTRVLGIVANAMGSFEITYQPVSVKVDL